MFLVGLPCEDDHRFARFCPGWKGKCKGSQSYFMAKYCRKTCQECGGRKNFISLYSIKISKSID